MVFELDGKILLPYGWTYFNFQSILYIRYNIIITKCCSRRQRDLLSLLNEMLIGWKQCWSLEAGGIYCRYFRRAAATSLLLSTDEVHNAQNMFTKCTKQNITKQNMFTECIKYVHKMHKICLQNAWNMFTKYKKYVYKMHEICSQNARNKVSPNKICLQNV